MARQSRFYTGRIKRKGPHTAKWRRAVRHIRRKGKVRNPYAVATASLGRESFYKRSRRS